MNLDGKVGLLMAVNVRADYVDYDVKRITRLLNRNGYPATADPEQIDRIVEMTAMRKLEQAMQDPEEGEDP